MKNTPLKIIYFGTADFAVPPLQALLNDQASFEVVAVVSQPDRPAGRKGELKASPVSAVARESGLDLFQPEKLDEKAIWTLQELEADVYVVAAYGLIMPHAVLDIPPGGALNLHGSLLPKYRGASPIQTAILEGETETGVTLMKMDAKMDHGAILDTVRVEIMETDDYLSLTGKLAEAAAGLLVEALPKYQDGELTAEEQDHDAATYTKILKKEDGRIDWNQPATRIERQIRAYRPWPGTFTADHLKILAVEIKDAPLPEGIAPGTITKTEDCEPLVACADRWLKLEEVQPPSKKPMTGADWLRGHPEIETLQ
jgi:methionyl-tRNA formyltransferase